MLSQYPAFIQDYIQRLGGTVDALTDVVEDFDASALAAGLTRSQALQDMTGTAFLEARAADMQRTFARHVALSDQLSRLRNATEVERIWMAPRVSDAETLRATWGDFSPAMPMTIAGILSSLIGCVTGWSLMALIICLMRGVFPQKTQHTATDRPATHAA